MRPHNAFILYSCFLAGLILAAGGARGAARADCGSLCLARISPSTGPAGGPSFILTASGAGFGPSSVLRWNGEQRWTSFVSSTVVTARIPASDLASQGYAVITVVNGGAEGETGPKTFAVVASETQAVARVTARRQKVCTPDMDREARLRVCLAP